MIIITINSRVTALFEHSKKTSIGVSAALLGILLSVACNNHEPIRNQNHALKVATYYLDRNFNFGKRKISDYATEVERRRQFLTKCDGLPKFVEEECIPNVYAVMFSYIKDNERASTIFREGWPTEYELEGEEGIPEGCASIITVYLEIKTGKVVEVNKQLASQGMELICD